MTIPYKTSLKYKLCWDFNWKITQRVSHATPAHRYVHIYISLVHFSPHLLKPKHNHHSMSLSLSVLQPQGLFFPSEESITHGRMLGNTAWVEDRGNGNPKPWVPGRSVPVIHSVALCQALSHELVLENKQKISFFFFFFFRWGRLISLRFEGNKTSVLKGKNVKKLTQRFRKWQYTLSLFFFPGMFCPVICRTAISSSCLKVSLTY